MNRGGRKSRTKGVYHRDTSNRRCPRCKKRLHPGDDLLPIEHARLLDNGSIQIERSRWHRGCWEKDLESIKEK